MATKSVVLQSPGVALETNPCSEQTCPEVRLKHSEDPIIFSCEDQWTSFSEPGKFPLVLDPVVAGSRLTRVLIDGGRISSS